VKLVELKE